MSSYAGIQMLMEKLKQLINCNDNPFINTHSIIYARPQFQLLYDDLGSMIQTLIFIDLEKLIHLKKRFIYAAEEAHYILDLFVSGVHVRNNGHFPTSEDFKRSLNLDDVRRSFESVKVEVMSMRIDNMNNTDSSQRIILNQSASISRNSQKLWDENVVGFDRDAELIRDKLVEDQKKVDVVSIVGMGGIGKTTLATKVFNDRFIMHHFHVRVWLTVSQTYDKRAVLIQILSSIGVKEDLEEASDPRLRELVHKKLMGRRYLIVIDDIWDIEAWDNLKLFFPHDNTGSRILLTSRFTEVAKHAKSDGLIHDVGSLNQERSWELLCEKVFHGNECPKWSIKPGMQIVENCKGLPLAVVVIAGILAKEAWSRNLWMEIAERTGSYIVGEENGCLETLGLSYNHLPPHLRECFLYLGGFPEDHEIEVRKLIWLWVAEGFIEEDGNRRLEDIAEGYLMDLIDRNLVTVAKRKKLNGGGVKVCKVHDLVRELCLKKAREEQFILQIESQSSNVHDLVRELCLKIAREERFILETERFSEVITTPYKTVRKFINTTQYKPVRKFINRYITDLSHPSTRNLRSILCFSKFRSLSVDIAKYFRSFVLLRVLDLHKCHLLDFPKGMELLVHLRYLAIWCSSEDFPSSICNLWNLQTLIYKTRRLAIALPSNISDLVNLRHLRSVDGRFCFGSIEKPMSLQTMSVVKFKDEASSFQKYFPCIKKLKCIAVSDKQNDFKSLTNLESLSLWSYPVLGKNHITFPATLKTLGLGGCLLRWSDMSIIQSLPNLQVLKLRFNSFERTCWNTDEQQFPQLKFLKLEVLDIKQWEAYSRSFPCLKQLKIIHCYSLEEIPLEIGDIPTLEFIQIYECRESLCECVRRIQEEQQDMGNYDLKIDVITKEDFLLNA